MKKINSSVTLLVYCSLIFSLVLFNTFANSVKLSFNSNNEDLLASSLTASVDSQSKTSKSKSDFDDDDDLGGDFGGGGDLDDLDDDDAVGGLSKHTSSLIDKVEKRQIAEDKKKEKKKEKGDKATKGQKGKKKASQKQSKGAEDESNPTEGKSCDEIKKYGQQRDYCEKKFLIEFGEEKTVSCMKDFCSICCKDKESCMNKCNYTHSLFAGHDPEEMLISVCSNENMGKKFNQFCSTMVNAENLSEYDQCFTNFCFDCCSNEIKVTDFKDPEMRKCLNMCQPFKSEELKRKHHLPADKARILAITAKDENELQKKLIGINGPKIPIPGTEVIKKETAVAKKLGQPVLMHQPPPANMNLPPKSQPQVNLQTGESKRGSIIIDDSLKALLGEDIGSPPAPVLPQPPPSAPAFQISQTQQPQIQNMMPQIPLPQHHDPMSAVGKKAPPTLAPNPSIAQANQGLFFNNDVLEHASPIENLNQMQYPVSVPPPAKPNPQPPSNISPPVLKSPPTNSNNPKSELQIQLEEIKKQKEMWLKNGFGFDTTPTTPKPPQVSTQTSLKLTPANIIDQTVNPKPSVSTEGSFKITTKPLTQQPKDKILQIPITKYDANSELAKIENSAEKLLKKGEEEKLMFEANKLAKTSDYYEEKKKNLEKKKNGKICENLILSFPNFKHLGKNIYHFCDINSLSSEFKSIEDCLNNLCGECCAFLGEDNQIMTCMKQCNGMKKGRMKISFNEKSQIQQTQVEYEAELTKIEQPKKKKQFTEEYELQSIKSEAPEGTIIPKKPEKEQEKPKPLPQVHQTIISKPNETIDDFIKSLSDNANQEDKPSNPEGNLRTRVSPVQTVEKNQQKPAQLVPAQLVVNDFKLPVPKNPSKDFIDNEVAKASELLERLKELEDKNLKLETEQNRLLREGPSIIKATIIQQQQKSHSFDFSNKALNSTEIFPNFMNDTQLTKSNQIYFKIILSVCASRYFESMFCLSKTTRLPRNPL